MWGLRVRLFECEALEIACFVFTCGYVIVIVRLLSSRVQMWYLYIYDEGTRAALQGRCGVGGEAEESLVPLRS